MLRRARRLITAAATILLASILWLAPIAGQSPPATTALNTFEALRAAENAGANITGLVNQYNTLIQQNAPNSSFASLAQLASNAQQDALALRSSSQTLTLVLIPILALTLSLVTEGLLQLRRKIGQNRLLEMEIENT
jgi:predicted PurR-regulated permease PerM